MISREIAGQHDPITKLQIRLSELESAVAQKSRMLKSANRKYRRQLIRQKCLEKEVQNLRQQIDALAAQLSCTEKKVQRNVATRLHEKAGQFLVLARMKAGKLKNLPEQQEHIISIVSDIDTLIELTLESIRAIVHDLGPSKNREYDLPTMITCIHTRIEKEFGIRFCVSGLETICIRDPGINSLLCSAVWELIMNSLRHAQAGNLCVRFEQAEDRIRIAVADDGIGFIPSLAWDGLSIGTGFGLCDIRERIHAVGGSIELNSAPGKGTRVMIDAPIRLPCENKETDAP